MTESAALSKPVFNYPIRVFYEDTDAAGIVYYANYLKFAERARTEWLRHLGFDHIWLKRQHGLVFAVRRCTADYIRPARLDDLLDVRTAVTKVAGATIEMAQDIYLGDTHLVAVQVKLACLNETGAPMRMPADLRQAMRVTE
ncbi:tol-pal system-associated acyl-CoA thioesterase [Hwanghaeella sp.]|uniref:tol-pal system-associated acyl-CoA thioesterase n=1 Tax=Hwanghaeella sp. TaxID=2605943 RepID=UPI003CCB9EC5